MTDSLQLKIISNSVSHHNKYSFLPDLILITFQFTYIFKMKFANQKLQIISSLSFDNFQSF